MTITHRLPDQPTITQEYQDDSLTRIISSSIYSLHLPSLRGVYAVHNYMDRLEHLETISMLDDEDFKALAQYIGENK